MKLRRTFGMRALLALLLLAQLAGAGVPLADALLEAAAARGERIGAPSDRAGLAVHVEGDCVLCQHIAHGGAATRPLPAGQVVLASRTMAWTGTADRPRVRPLLLERGRSPPTV